MVPYFADDLVTLYLGDCREVTEWLSADVLVTDPPYGRGSLGIAYTNETVGRRYYGAASMADPDPIIGDEDTGMRDAALGLWGERPAVVFGDLRVPVPAATKQVLVYEKPTDSGVRSTAGFRRDAEAICLLRLSAGYGGRSSIIRTAARKINGTGGPASRYGHPHAKPVDVLETLISACPAGVIADPFAGSGSTLIAARNQGRRAIGVEVDERYAEAAARRLAQAVLFAEVQVKFTRRHARALATGAAATAAYLAGARMGDSRAVRGGALLTLAAVATLGRVQASAVAKTTKKRLDQHVSDTANAVHLYNSHGTALNSLATNSAVLLTLAGSIDPTFLAGMTGPMANQTTSNATISTTAGTFTNPERVAFNGLVNAVNTLQSHLQGANIEN